MNPEFIIFIGGIICWILFTIIGGVLAFNDLISKIPGEAGGRVGLEATKFEVGIDAME